MNPAESMTAALLAYNEGEKISELVGDAGRVIDRFARDYEIVVDDSSRYGTGDPAHARAALSFGSPRGWRPGIGATSSNQGLWAERFDNGKVDVLNLTAQNSGAVTSTIQLNLDAETLEIGDGTVQVRDLVRDKFLTFSRSGSDIQVSDMLGPGETVLHRIAKPQSGPPQNGPIHVITRD